MWLLRKIWFVGENAVECQIYERKLVPLKYVRYITNESMISNRITMLQLFVYNLYNYVAAIPRKEKICGKKCGCLAGIKYAKSKMAFYVKHFFS